MAVRKDEVDSREYKKIGDFIVLISNSCSAATKKKHTRAVKPK